MRLYSGCLGQEAHLLMWVHRSPGGQQCENRVAARPADSVLIAARRARRIPLLYAVDPADPELGLTHGTGVSQTPRPSLTKPARSCAWTSVHPEAGSRSWRLPQQGEDPESHHLRGAAPSSVMRSPARS